MHIQPYSIADEPALFLMLREEGDSWSDYHGPQGYKRYQDALRGSLTYLLYDGEALCGYARGHEDHGFGVYIHDLLVRKEHRGRQYGRLLMEQFVKDYPGQAVYVLSDVDPYYEKLGYPSVGTVFAVGGITP
ncbi:MAG TPA: GNAT family N-acetyltransferase [Candidatus Limiplasma sp.]|nr:GNAT family N-acetyltransferase [Candidatus Limiplasma sp.]HRX08558.1 GNAT family N-acetyltransferase [Candidatus Limiplasma sp.]